MQANRWDSSNRMQRSRLGAFIITVLLFASFSSKGQRWAKHSNLSGV